MLTKLMTEFGTKNWVFSSNYISNAEIRFGGGVVNAGSIPQEIAPVDIRDARPTIRFSDLRTNAVAAISATPDSFEETNFHSAEFQSIRFTSDYSRIGPEISDNTLSGNSINGLLVSVQTLAGSSIQKQTVSGRWNDSDIVHVVSGVLEIEGTPGGGEILGGNFFARLDASLIVDPNVIVKLDGARIELGIGAHLIAEGLDGQEVVFTSIEDDRFGASGTFDTSSNSATTGTVGDWAGIYLGHSSTGSFDHALFTFGGGFAPIEGGTSGFNVIEVQQANARIANSTFIDNGSGIVGQVTNRAGRGLNGAATVFVRGAQPVIINNTFLNSDTEPPLGPALGANDLVAAISINTNSLNQQYVIDYGRMTGHNDSIEGDTGNQGPLIRDNRLGNNDINGLLVRGETLDTEGVWDDTDIVHVLFDTVHVPNFRTYGGLRLESNESESLVVKIGGSRSAGFDTTGQPGAIQDRIGGSLHVVGQPGRPVVLTSLTDETVGAGLTPEGAFQNQTIRSEFGGEATRGGLKINFNYSAEVEANPILVAGLEEAARFWESQLTDDITISYDVVIEERGSAPFASAGPSAILLPHDEVIERLQLDAAFNESDLLSRLPLADQITVQGPDGNFTLSDTISVGYPNAKALGYVEGVDFAAVPSAVKAGATRDGMITVTALHQRGSTIDGFAGVMIHEIGHTMGFLSSLPEDGVFAGSASLTTMDLFRLAPGGGAADFTNSPRVLDPVREQVFYDGGLFNPAGINIPGLTLGDIPVSRGTTFADGSIHPDDGQPSHWRSQCAVGINGIYLGIMDPGGGGCQSAYPGKAADVLQTDVHALGLMGWDVAGFGISAQPTAGDWQGIQLDELTNDRNVEIAVELESGDSSASGANGIPDRAEFVGSLAGERVRRG